MQNGIRNEGAEVNDHNERGHSGNDETQSKLAFPAGPEKEESTGHPQQEFRQASERVELQSVQPESTKYVGIDNAEVVGIQQHIGDRKSQ